jgi:ABC-type Na+ efflux pump permease subunit
MVFIVIPIAILILIAKAIAMLIREIVGERNPKT